jgi:hypothetical protein
MPSGATPSEVTFVREVFGLSRHDLAHAMNVAPLTVARWEGVGPRPAGLQNEVVRVLHRAATEVRRRNDPDLARSVGTTIAVGIGALLLDALLAEIARLDAGKGVP